MKYALGVVGSILNTGNGGPEDTGLDSLPLSPSYGCPAGDTFPASLYR